MLRFRVLGASFSSFGCFVFDLGCFVFEIWVLRASVFVFECFVFKTTLNHRGPTQSVCVADCYFIVNVLDLPFASPITIYR